MWFVFVCFVFVRACVKSMCVMFVVHCVEVCTVLCLFLVFVCVFQCVLLVACCVMLYGLHLVRVVLCSCVLFKMCVRFVCDGLCRVAYGFLMVFVFVCVCLKMRLWFVCDALYGAVWCV